MINYYLVDKKNVHSLLIHRCAENGTLSYGITTAITKATTGARSTTCEVSRNALNRACSTSAIAITLVSMPKREFVT